MLTSIYIKYIFNGYNTLKAFWISLKDLKSSLEELIYKAPCSFLFLFKLRFWCSTTPACFTRTVATSSSTRPGPSRSWSGWAFDRKTNITKGDWKLNAKDYEKRYCTSWALLSLLFVFFNCGIQTQKLLNPTLTWSQSRNEFRVYS